MSWKSVFSGIALVALLACGAFAQDLKSQVNVEGIAGIQNGSNNFLIPTNMSVGGGFLAGYRYNLSPLFAVEGDYGWMRSTQNLLDLGNLGSAFGVSTNIQELTGAAVLTPGSNHRVRPYLMAGGGAVFFHPTNNALDTALGIGNNVGLNVNETKPAFLYGGGVDIGLTRYMALRAEYRGLLFKAPGLDIPGVSNIPVIGSLTSSSLTHMAQPAVGLVWRF
jgi:opacity protein-like surface antigen